MYCSYLLDAGEYVTRAQSAPDISNILIKSGAPLAVQTVFIISGFFAVQNTLEDNKLSAK